MNDTQQATFYWLDYETFGTDPARDRACQFAGVRTDMDFNIIGDPLVIYCQPTDDYLPAPEACLITGITPQLAKAKGLSEPEFIRAIHDEISKPNTCVVGYNNIRFDDEVTRHLLYRNFYDPYAWAWQNRNSRWDLLDVLRTCFALRPEGIEWPIDDNTGQVSFKLENLSVANGIEHENAHDAMADVIATIEMAKRVKHAQPKLFNFLFELRNKKKVQALLDPVNMTPVVHISGMLGNECSNTSWMVPIAWHPTNNNAVITVNLAKDLSPLFDLDADDLRTRLYTKHSDLCEGELPVPLKLIHVNKCPVVAPAKTLTAEDAARIGIDRQYCLDNLQRLKNSPSIREKILKLYADEPEFKSSKPPSPDATLYDGFFSSSDKSTLDIIRQTAPEKLIDMPLNVEDLRIAPLIFQYRARHYPMTLDEHEQKRWALHRRELFEAQLPQYMLNLENLALEHEHDTSKMKILEQVYRYVESIAS
ncbi:exodeoxyribonuclease I [Thaumasiovibrio subtropicus]|uniref:exodeoxyribonuclease I n=1 Tax=Thaumasiovibrio subtropicus TaxID=1891207 RepID=UPI000B34F0A9|nr:exodeoxyribonuclease I [Thaumasiovibrio subtropicus]